MQMDSGVELSRSSVVAWENRRIESRMALDMESRLLLLSEQEPTKYPFVSRTELLKDYQKHTGVADHPERMIWDSSEQLIVILSGEKDYDKLEEVVVEADMVSPLDICYREERDYFKDYPWKSNGSATIYSVRNTAVDWDLELAKNNKPSKDSSSGFKTWERVMNEEEDIDKDNLDIESIPEIQSPDVSTEDEEMVERNATGILGKDVVLVDSDESGPSRDKLPKCSTQLFDERARVTDRGRDKNADILHKRLNKFHHNLRRLRAITSHKHESAKGLTQVMLSDSQDIPTVKAWKQLLSVWKDIELSLDQINEILGQYDNRLKSNEKNRLLMGDICEDVKFINRLVPIFETLTPNHIVEVMFRVEWKLSTLKGHMNALRSVAYGDGILLSSEGDSDDGSARGNTMNISSIQRTSHRCKTAGSDSDDDARIIRRMMSSRNQGTSQSRNSLEGQACRDVNRRRISGLKTGVDRNNSRELPRAPFVQQVNTNNRDQKWPKENDFAIRMESCMWSIITV